MKLARDLAGTKKLALVATLLAILIASLFLRFPTFYLPHNHGDQIQYLALAMKLDGAGFRQYNLRGVDLFRSKEGQFLGVLPAPEGSSRALLKSLPSYYDEPLFHKPPLFVYALMFSHRLFAPQKPYAVVGVNLGGKVLSHRPKAFLVTQFYAVIVPLLSSLLLIAAAFVLGKLLFSRTTAVYAAILLSTSPIALLTSQRIWTDDMCAFFVTASCILYYLGSKRRNLTAAFLAGLCAAGAALTKPSGSIVIFIILAYALWKKAVFNKIFLSFLVTAVLVAFPWHQQILKTYGSLFYLPMANHAQLIKLPWFKFVLERPWYMYFVNIPVQTPLLIFVYPAIVTIFRRCPDEEAQGARDKKIFLFIWIVMFLTAFLSFRVGRELRYLLPAYPAIAILSAERLEAAGKRLEMRFGRLGPAIVMLVLGLSAVWSLAIGWDAVFNNLPAIKLPL